MLIIKKTVTTANLNAATIQEVTLTDPTLKKPGGNRNNYRPTKIIIDNDTSGPISVVLLTESEYLEWQSTSSVTALQTIPTGIIEIYDRLEGEIKNILVLGVAGHASDLVIVSQYQ